MTCSMSFVGLSGADLEACIEASPAVSTAELEAWVAARALAMSFDDRLANLAAHGSDLSAHLEHGTLLSQPVLALAQLRQAIGVLPAIAGMEGGRGREGSLISWYVA